MNLRKPKILAFSGSLRRNSLNKKLVEVAAAGAEAAGASVTLIDLKDFPLPVYDGDVESEQGLPPEALELKKIFAAHDGFLISSPEYNYGYTGALKNVIDWVSRRSEAGEPMLSVFRGKHAAFLSATGGPSGGIRSIGQLRDLFLNMGVTVIPKSHALGNANQEFDVAGRLKNPETIKRAQDIGVQLAKALQ